MLVEPEVEWFRERHSPKENSRDRDREIKFILKVTFKMNFKSL